MCIACSRWRRCPGARASSFTRLAAFLSRQAPFSIVRAPTGGLETTEQPDSHRLGSLALRRLGSLYTFRSSRRAHRIHYSPRLSCPFSYKIRAWTMNYRRIGTGARLTHRHKPTDEALGSFLASPRSRQRPPERVCVKVCRSHCKRLTTMVGIAVTLTFLGSSLSITRQTRR